MTLTAFPQSGESKQLTKFEEFSSKTGSIIKFVDFSLPKLSLSWGPLGTSILVMKANKDSYFYRIEEAETRSSVAHIAMIEYSDLVEINKALVKLTSEVESDIVTNPDYLENKFITTDGFQVGYYVNKGSAHWYLKLERYSSSTVFVKNQEVLVEAFTNAQKKNRRIKSWNKLRLVISPKSKPRR